MPKDFSFNKAEFCANLPKKTGVYRMYGANGEILYIGKAINLKSRVSSYFNRPETQSIKTQAMVKKIHAIEISFCETEIEALILEQNLIKELKPPYNINLRDNKSYPYLEITKSEDYPLIRFRRNIPRVKSKNQFFGPYPNSEELKRGISLVTKIFRLRDCSNAEFKNRSRPCLKYQINRCSAPCVGLISKQDYKRDSRSASQFLTNKNTKIISDLTNRMNQAAQRLDFEQAALIRDQVRSLKSLNQTNLEGRDENFDLVVVAFKQAVVLIHILTIRGGKVGIDFNYYFDLEHPTADNLSLLQLNFLNQYYLSDLQDYPNRVYLKNHPLGLDLLAQAIEQKKERKIEFKKIMRGFVKLSFKHASLNAEKILNRYLEKKLTYSEKIRDLKALTNLSQLERFECYDVSHTFGAKTVGSMVVFDDKGPKKSQYRLFNLENVAGDDLKAIKELLTRRLEHRNWPYPDLWLIDGGKSHLKVAYQVLKENHLKDFKLIAIAKGRTRKAGFESLMQFKEDKTYEEFLSPSNKALHLIQQIRDESHRFAITHHRKRRIKAQKSILDMISGVGETKRKALLLHFSDISAIKRASLEDLKKVNGISEAIAKNIYDFFQLKSD